MDRAYSDAMKRVRAQLEGSQRLALRVLSWITCAKRPLTALEIQHALAVKPGDTKLDEDNFLDVEDIVSVCAGLVSVDKESSIIRLVHYTTQKYFEDFFPNAATDIATACVTYLSFSTFGSGSCYCKSKFKKRLDSNALYSYAARYWGHHTRMASTEVEYLVLDFLQEDSKVSSASEATLSPEYPTLTDCYYPSRSQMTGVHLAAYFGLDNIIIALLKRGVDPDPIDSYGWTPLSYAAAQGYMAVVRLLLKTDGVNADSKGQYPERTPLSYAAEEGHVMVARVLLESNKVDPDSKDNNGLSPLTYAAKNGHEEVVKLLLDWGGVDPDSGDNNGLLPWSYAVQNGHEAVSHLLFPKGVDLDSKNKKGRTRFSYAAESGFDRFIRLLLANGGVDPDSTDYYSRTPLSYTVGAKLSYHG